MNKSYANKMVFLLNQKNIQNYNQSRNQLKKAKLKYDERQNLYLSLPKLKSIYNSENEIIVEDNKNILLNKLNFSLEKDKEKEMEIEKRNKYKYKYNFNYKSNSTKNIFTKHSINNIEYLSPLNDLSLNQIDFNNLKMKIRRLKQLKKRINPDNVFKTIDNKNLYFYHKNKKEDNNKTIQENRILKEESKNNMEKIRKGLIILNELAKESSSLDSKRNPLRRKTTLKRIFSFNSKI